MTDRHALTTGELIAKLQKLDPTGSLPVALRGDSGATIRPVQDIELDMLLVCSGKAKAKYPENASFASRGIYRKSAGIKGLGLVVKGQVVCID